MKTSHKTGDRRRRAAYLLYVWCVVLAFSAGCVTAPPKQTVVSSQKQPREQTRTMPDPLNLVREGNAHIIEAYPDAAAAKFKKMSSDLYVFYRGASDVFYRYNEYYGIAQKYTGGGLMPQLHGDYHLENVGAYKSEKGDIVFDLIDFDDAFQGPAVLDLRRMAVSIIIACDAKGYADQAEEIVKLFVESYVRTLRDIASGKTSADFCYRSGSQIPPVETIIDAVKRVDRHEFLEKFCKTHIGGSGKRVFNHARAYLQVEDKAFIRTAMGRYLDTVLPEYRHDDDYYAVKDVVISNKSGIGSVGKMRYLVLIEGETTDQFDDVVLEFKEERHPFWAETYGASSQQNGRRVFMGFYLMQSEVYPCIGYVTVDNKDFFVSELSPHYREFEIDDIRALSDLKDMAVVAGVLIAKGHVRGEKAQAETALVIAEEASSETFVRDLLKFSYACFAYFKTGFEDFRERLKKSPLL